MPSRASPAGDQGHADGVRKFETESKREGRGRRKTERQGQKVGDKGRKQKTQVRLRFTPHARF